MKEGSIQMKEDILLIAHFCSDFDGKGNNRFNYLAELLANNKLNVELLTSDFSHNTKKKRERNISGSLNYKVTFIEEPIYKKNVSLKRFYSHYMMAINLKKYLHCRRKPSVIYCAVPSLDVAYTVAKYAKENSIRFIIDIQDIWPEAFKMIFNVPIISDMVFYPMERQAKYIYKLADEIVSVSETYSNKAIAANTKTSKGNVVFLGTDLNEFDKMFNNYRYQNKPVDEIWIAYAGTLGHSYDLTIVFDALESLMDKGINNFKFIVMGDGPLKEKFEAYSRENGVNVLFTGRLPYAEMVGLLGVCDIAVNPISHGAAASIINKHGDYAAAGLPVLNTQECQEYRTLVDYYQMGINCNNNDSKDLEEKLLLLLNNSQLRIEMGKNSRRLAEEKFDRKKTYKVIMDLLQGKTQMDEHKGDKDENFNAI